MESNPTPQTHNADLFFQSLQQLGFYIGDFVKGCKMQTVVNVSDQTCAQRFVVLINNT